MRLVHRGISICVAGYQGRREVDQSTRMQGSIEEDIRADGEEWRKCVDVVLARQSRPRIGSNVVIIA